MDGDARQRSWIDTSAPLPADRAELLRMQAQLNADSDSITQQLDDARGRLREEGEPIDGEWQKRAEYKLGLIKRQKRRVAEALALLKEETKRANIARVNGAVRDKHLRFIHAFYRRAKSDLEPAVFRAILNAAHDAVDLEHPDATDCDMCCRAEDTRV